MATLARTRAASALRLRQARYLRQVNTSSSGEPSREPPARPWFLRGQPPEHVESQRLQNELEFGRAPPPPPDAPAYIRTIHGHLSTAPAVVPSSLHIGPPQPRPLRAEPPEYLPTKGKRKRGMKYAGQGFNEPPGFWRWVVVAEVKEGTEGRGAIESILRSTRTVLSQTHPELPLPPKSRRQATDGWGMLDVGDTAVHVVSRSARKKWFSDEDGEFDANVDVRTFDLQAPYIFRSPI